MSTEEEFDGKAYFVKLVTQAKFESIELGLFSDGSTFLDLDGLRIFYQLEVNEYGSLFSSFEVEIEPSEVKDLDQKILKYAATRRPNFGGITLTYGAEGPVLILFADLILTGELDYDIDNLKWVIENISAWNYKIITEISSF